MRFATIGACFVAALVVGSAAAAPPPTAQCRDGTLSYARHHSGACSHHHGVARWLGPTVTSDVQVAAGRTVLLQPRSRSAACRRGALPDRRCSPGAISTGLSKTVICSPSFRTGAVRNVSQATKGNVEREYGLPSRPYGRTIEIDHIVSLELGGSNDPANLFPEPGSGADNYHVKDKLENKLHALVCAGRMSLRAAQQQIAANWERVYAQVFGLHRR